MLQLILPEAAYLDSVRTAVAEYKNSPSPFDINSVQKLILAADDNFATYFSNIEKARNAVNLPQGYVPSTTLWLLKDGQYVGSFDIRHYLTDALLQIGGHIAYQIIPSQRRKGLVKAGLKLALKYCRNVLSLDKALLTCRFENTASYKAMTAVMKEYGGYEDTPSDTEVGKEHRVWIMTAPIEK